VASLENIFAAMKLLKSKGTTIALITHSLAVLNQAEHAFLVCGGQIVDQGSTEKIRRYFEGKCKPCHHENIPDELN
jgi:Fe-S cluster assembly ATP-binding protein